MLCSYSASLGHSLYVLFMSRESYHCGHFLQPVTVHRQEVKGLGWRPRFALRLLCNPGQMPCAGDHCPAAHHVALCGVTGGDVSECTSYQALIRGRLSRHCGGYSHIFPANFVAYAQVIVPWASVLDP